MTVKKICFYPDPVLREETQPVEKFDDELRSVVADMFETMYANEGVGLAAPQVGISKKIVVIDYHGDKHVLINPEITSEEGEAMHEEGCLSFPGIFEVVPAPEKITVEYQDEKGESHNDTLEGFIACVFHHEIDHLNSRLLIDRVSPLKRQFIKKKIAKRTREN